MASSSGAADLVFGPRFTLDCADFVLIELPSTLLPALKEDKCARAGARACTLSLTLRVCVCVCVCRLAIVGVEEGDCVLVSAAETYALRQVETSNALLCIPPPDAHSSDADVAGGTRPQSDAKRVHHDDDSDASGAPQQLQRPRWSVAANCTYTIEVVPSAPRVREALQALQMAAATAASGALAARSGASAGGDDEEAMHAADVDGDEDDGPLLQFVPIGAVLERVQASEQELRAYLREVRAVVSNDVVAYLDAEREGRFIDLLLCTIDEKGWDWRRVSGDELVRAAAPSVPAVIGRHLVLHFATEPDADGMVSLKELEVCRWRAHQLLRSGAVRVAGRCAQYRIACASDGALRAQAYWIESQFVVTLEQCVPLGMRPELWMCRGLVVREAFGLEARIRFVDPDALPAALGARIDKLFSSAPKWALADFAAFFVDLLPTAAARDAVRAAVRQSVADMKALMQHALPMLRPHVRVLDDAECTLVRK
jgi:hypothetical protein